MQLLDHVSIGVPDLDIARRFYDAIMSTLGAARYTTFLMLWDTASDAPRRTLHRPISRYTWIRAR